MVAIPSEFAARIAGRPADPRATSPVDGDAWLDRLPHLLADYLERWNLRAEEGAWSGENAIVVPVRRGTGEAAALKLTWPHVESEWEHLALRLWNGRGAVRMLAADPPQQALLLERLDATRPLSHENVIDACEVLGGLFRTLDCPAPAQVEALEERAGRWHRVLTEPTPLVPRRLQDQARAAVVDLLAGVGEGRLVHEDLHDGNVLAPLAAERGEWLAIDPKPVAGEWAYAVAPVVWNRAEETARAYNLRTHTRMRAEIVAEVAGLDQERVRGWTFVRLVLNALWAAEHAPASDEFRARMITLAKAFAS